jgi:hypothetical protein
MQNNAAFFLGLRLVFTTLFVITLAAGVYGAKHYQKLFGIDPSMPSDTRSARNYTKLLVIMIWAHAVLITGGFAWML